MEHNKTRKGKGTEKKKREKGGEGENDSLWFWEPK
jgi:hypothetical protein